MGVAPPFFSWLKIKTMASGRVGGTKSKISGVIGNEVYQVVRQPDGSYAQVVYGKPESVIQKTTPRLQAQRMCTCMVEALMRDLKPVGNISFQSAANKSKSLNAFSSYNLSLVARDCKANWYRNNQFIYPTRDMKEGTTQELGGPWILSAGSGQFDVFDRCLWTDNPLAIWSKAWAIGCQFSGVGFSVSMNRWTLADFMKQHRMTRLDKVVFVCFHDWWVDDPKTDERFYNTAHSYIIAQINPALPDNTLINQNVLDNLFVYESDREFLKQLSDDGSTFYFGVLVDNAKEDANIYYYNGFSISYLDGRKKITSKTLKTQNADGSQWLLDHAPADVFWSWMDSPGVKPYPSPF